jgi:SH3-like domain-containing protein
MKQKTMPCSPVLAGLAGLFFCAFVQAAEFRSVSVPKAIGYDAPSSEATKTLIYSKDYPLEVIVNLGDWLKLRDQQGSLVWLENKQLSQKRMVFVLERTDISLDETQPSALVATVEKGVSLELMSANFKSGMVKVKHRDGLSGYIQASKLWGIN